jgi:3-oxoacyl-(acyl-carrier-protein) synthase
MLHRALSNAAASHGEVGVAYLSGSGDPHHDTAELTLLAATFGVDGPLLTAVTHLTGEYGGLGVLRVAAAVTTLTTGLLPTLDYLCQPLRTDVRLARQGMPLAAPLAIVHGLARGGLQVVLLLGRRGNNEKGPG